MELDHVAGLECVLCGATYEPGVRYTCPEHDGVRGILEVTYDYGAVAERFEADRDGRRGGGVWDYRAFLPVPDGAAPVSLGEGGTPLLEAPRLGDALGADLAVKDDGRNPTGVLKDRASAVSVTIAAATGADAVTCASTGNAAASLAGYAARAGIDCRIFVPESAPEGKLVQPLVYGADVLAVEGSYDEAYDLSLEATEAFGWYNRNAAINPYQVEGKRTVGHELAGEAPDADWVVLAMGDGCTVAGAWKGLREFRDLGYRESAPRVLGVQAEGASAIHDAFHGHGSADEVAETVADSIAVGRPRNTVKACRALEESGGDAVTVTDEALLEAEGLLGRTEGVYAEPAGAAPVAGVREARAAGIIDRGDRVVVVSTGTGLKDAASGRRAADGGPTRVEPSMAAVRSLYG